MNSEQSSEFSDEADCDGLDTAVGRIDGGIVFVRGLEAGAGAFGVEAFQCHGIIIDESNDYLACGGGLAFFAYHVVAIVYTRLCHAVTGDLEGEDIIACAEFGRKGDMFLISYGVDGLAGCYAAKQRDTASRIAIGRRCLLEILKQRSPLRGQPQRASLARRGGEQVFSSQSGDVLECCGPAYLQGCRHFLHRGRIAAVGLVLRDQP